MPPAHAGMSRLQAMAKEVGARGIAGQEREIVHLRFRRVLRPATAGAQDSFSQELPAFDRFLAV